jgi:hypothetical protein
MGDLLAAVGGYRVDRRLSARFSHPDGHRDTSRGDLGLAAVDELSRLRLAPLGRLDFAETRRGLVRRHDPHGRSGTPRERGRRNWLVIAVPFFVVLFLAQIYGAITGHLTISSALLLTLNLIIALLLFETLLHFSAKRISAPAGLPAQAEPHVVHVIVRCIRVAAYIGVGVTIAQTWIVEVIGMVDSTRWRSIMLHALTAGGVLFAAYVGWEAIHFLTDSYIARNSPAAMGPAEEEGAPPSTATRLATILPLLRMAAIIVIFVVAPLAVAAVSIFGLACHLAARPWSATSCPGSPISATMRFASANISIPVELNMVEGFTLRSIKLRHQKSNSRARPSRCRQSAARSTKRRPALRQAPRSAGRPPAPRRVEVERARANSPGPA